MPVGDKLARGDKSAAFGGAGSTITDFEQDFAFLTKAEIEKKYGLSENEYDTYDKLRIDGQKLPDLPLASSQEVGPNFTVTDRRMFNALPEAKQVETKVSKYPAKEYSTGKMILDRILVKRIEDDPDIEVLEDGSARNRVTGMFIPASYRQHNNKGIVLRVGDGVGIGGEYFPLNLLVKPGDKVTFGSYNTEKFVMEFKQAKALCDSLEIDHNEADEPFQIVRIQDVRLVEALVTHE